jgi:hypothetical protein
MNLIRGELRLGAKILLNHARAALVTVEHLLYGTGDLVLRALTRYFRLGSTLQLFMLFQGLRDRLALEQLLHDHSHVSPFILVELDGLEKRAKLGSAVHKGCRCSVVL